MKTPQVAALPGMTPLGIKPQTALPYHTAEKGNGDECAVYGPTGEIVAEYCDPRDAKFIAKACNNHKKLVDALNTLVDRLGNDKRWVISDARCDAIKILKAMS